MAKILSKSGISTLQIVRPWHVTQSIDAFTGIEAYDISLSGSFTTTGSLIIKGTSTFTNGPITASVPIGIGSHVLASGTNAFAQGTGSNATGDFSFSQGRNTIASGFAAHAEGLGSQAKGAYAHAEGRNTIASGSYSHAQGRETTASGDYSHASGYGTRAFGNYQLVAGQFNITNTDNSSFIIGNGTSNSSRSNLLQASGSLVAITGSLVVSGSSPTTVTFGNSLFWSNPSASLTFTGSMGVSGSITSNGSNVITSNQTGSFLTGSTGAFATTGSNNFNGNQTVTGSMTITGSLTISGSNTLTNIGPFTQTGNSIFTGNITASNDISASGNITALDLNLFGGDIDLKNGGSPSTIKLYCESSNAHYTQLQAASHSAYSGNILTILPAYSFDFAAPNFQANVTASSFGGDGSALTNLQRPISNSVSTSFTASNSNSGFYFRAGGNVTCSLKVNATASCNVGNEFELFQTSSVGYLLIEADPGVTLNSKGSKTKLAGQFSGATLKKIGTNEWDLIGDLG